MFHMVHSIAVKGDFIAQPWHAEGIPVRADRGLRFTALPSFAFRCALPVLMFRRALTALIDVCMPANV